MIVQADQLQRLNHLALLGFTETGAGLERVTDVLPYGHVRPQRVVLKHHPDVAFLGGHKQALLHIGHSTFTEQDLPAVGFFQPGNAAQRGGFAAAAGAQQHEKFSGFDLQIQMLNGIDPTVEGFTDILENYTAHAQRPPVVPAARARARCLLRWLLRCRARRKIHRVNRLAPHRKIENAISTMSSAAAML